MMSLGVRLHVLSDSIATLITEMWAVMNKTWRMPAGFPSLEQQIFLWLNNTNTKNRATEN